MEQLERRVMLSAAVHHVIARKQVHPVIVNTAVAHPGAIELGRARSSPTASPAGSGVTGPFAPQQIKQFYGINSISFNGVAGDGTGQTIAVIDAYNDPMFSNSSGGTFSTSDLHVFDHQYGLADPPSFTVIPEAGQTSLPTTYNSGWAGETALDVEWAHAIAPAASIILVECASNGDTDLITNGVAAAIAAGATVISMSFGGGEASYYDSSFSGSSNVTYLASTGDNGGGKTGYPSLSPYVVGVSGTSITTSDSAADYGSEVVWNTSPSNNDGTGSNNDATGGGIASSELKPTYQSGETLSGTHRGAPDVSFLADPYTGVYVLDTSQSGGGGWYEYGGTSLSSPCWAGLIAIADQGAVLSGQSTMNGFNTTLPRLYELPSSAYHDITVGSNQDTHYSNVGYSAGVGYDLATGLGTPVANTLIPDLAGAGTITGRVFVDNNGDGSFNGTDTALSGKTVYLDLNNDGVLDNNEPSVTTDSNGFYTFTNEPAGGTVRLSNPTLAGYVAIPSSASIAYGTTDTINLTYFPTSFTSSTPTTNFTIQADATDTNQQILINGSVAYSIAQTVLITSALTFNLSGAGDSFTVNGANGTPIPTDGVIFTGPSGGGALSVIGSASANDAFVVTSNSISFNNNPISFSHVSLLTLNTGAGTDSLIVNSGSVTIPVQTPGSGILTRNFSNLNVSSGATALFATAPAHTDRMLVETTSLSVAGQLDLGGNDMIIHGGDLTKIDTLLGTGFNNGNWNGTGISSTAAHSDTAHLTALGAIANTLYGQAGQPQFDGTNPLTTDILIKFTYYGDTNLNGKVDGGDYSQIDYGFLFHLTGWANGDFNYDTNINGTDYTLIDNTFNMQGSPM